MWGKSDLVLLMAGEETARVWSLRGYASLCYHYEKVVTLSPLFARHSVSQTLIRCGLQQRKGFSMRQLSEEMKNMSQIGLPKREGFRIYINLGSRVV